MPPGRRARARGVTRCMALHRRRAAAERAGTVAVWPEVTGAVAPLEAVAYV